MCAAAVFEAVDRGDVGMIERGEHLRFATETSDPVAVERERVREDLQRDVTIELRIAGAVDLAHSTHADLSGDLVRTETSAGGECQREVAGIIGDVLVS